MTTFREIDARIKEILNTITTIERVYDTVPRTLNDTDMPCVVVTIQEGTHTRVDQSEVNNNRQWAVQLYFDDMNARGDGELETYAYDLDLIDEILETFNGRTLLQLNDSGLVLNSHIPTDTGLAMIPYPQNSEHFYLGVIFTLTTETSMYSPMKG